MIYLKEITKSYDRKILNRVSYHFENGKIYVIKGVSGSGKTTLLNILGLVDTNFEGKYYIDGLEVEKHNAKQIEKIRSQIGYVYQESLLISNLSIKENLLFFYKDEQEIIRLMKMFEIDSLLDKLPEQISNGERQRISIIRAILGGKNIIICDEPTASLDRESSKRFASEIEKLKNKGKIIIISTHEDVFDSIYDECINLNYGECIENEIHHSSIETLGVTDNKKYSFIKEDIKYSIKKCKKNSILVNIMLIFFLLILFFSVGFRLHFEDNYREQVIKDYPYHIISATDRYIKKRGLEDDVIVYENYHFVDENNNNFYSYLPYKDSCFRIPGILLQGGFPRSEKEVIINYSYYQNNFGNMKEEDVIGQKIINPMDNDTFIVSGILRNEEEVYNIVYNSSPLDPEISVRELPIVFVDYSYMQNHTEKTDQEFKIYSLKNINDVNLLQEPSVFYWDTIISEKMFTVNLITNFIFIFVFVLCIIAFLFIYNVVSLDLYYRRKEIGYLRLFSVSKKRLKLILKFSYLYKILIPIFYSIIIYEILMLFIKNYYIDISLSMIEIFVLAFALLIYVYILTFFPIKKMLKSDIKKLIQ